ncbi:MAG: TetR family transcriptional regulator C-terminal domain-containing protein [Aeromicrobium sp.]
MPRIVDHAERRAALAEAVWQVAREDGIGAISVRRVASAAGWSGGAVQYYFPTKTALLQYAFDVVGQRTVDRIHAIADEAGAEQALRSSIMSLLPLSREISAESAVWFAFMGLALAEDKLRKVAEAGHLAVAQAVRIQVERAQDTGVVEPRLDAEDVTLDLLALCDGLCVQELYRPWVLSPERLERILDAHLARLAPVGLA